MVLKEKQLLTVVHREFHHHLKEIIALTSGRFNANLETVKCVIIETENNKRV